MNKISVECLPKNSLLKRFPNLSPKALQKREENAKNLLRHRQVLSGTILREILKHMRSDVDGVIDENYNYFHWYKAFQRKYASNFTLQYQRVTPHIYKTFFQNVQRKQQR